MADPGGHFQIRLCPRPDCRFRFPVAAGEELGLACPRCGAATTLVEFPYHSHEVAPQPGSPRGPEVEALLDNIRSIYNVGSIFRTADGAGIRHLHLCGITTAPGHPRLAKTALGAEKAVAWTQHNNAVEAAAALKDQGCRLWAIEGGPQAESLFAVNSLLPGRPVVLVVGNELSGVDPGVLEQCERVLYLPMYGVKRSLNVVVAFGVAAYFVRFGFPPS